MRDLVRSKESICTYNSPSPNITYKSVLSRGLALRFRRKNIGRATHSRSIKAAKAIYVSHAAANEIGKAPTTLDLDNDSRMLRWDTLRLYGEVPEASKWYTLKTQSQDICCRDKCKESHQSPDAPIEYSVCGGN